jgi:hypothetical protein
MSAKFDSYAEIKGEIFDVLFARHGSSSAWRKYMETVRCFILGVIGKSELESIMFGLLGDKRKFTLYKLNFSLVMLVYIYISGIA